VCIYRHPPVAGLIALGAYTDPLGQESERAKREMKTAKALTYTCYQMYAQTETGLGPEIVDGFIQKTVMLRGKKKELTHSHDFQPKTGGSHYLLRPEG
jgi:mannosyl-oligosaccharide alpha-1,2-mannosidase